MVIETRSPEETFQFGEKLGREAKPGQIYTLNGDLGTGKTVFTQGFAAGLGITEPVNSPTFTIVQIYEEGRMPFYGEGVCLIEWAELIEEILPEHVIAVTIEKDLEQGFDYRKITLTGLD